MSNVISTIVKPWTALVASSVARIQKMPEPLRGQVDAHRNSGEDLTASVFREYATAQKELMGYRWTRLKLELEHVTTGGVALATITRRDLFWYSRALVRCVFLFLLFTFVGRGSVFPLLRPDSPLVASLDSLMTPNDRKLLGYE